MMGDAADDLEWWEIREQLRKPCGHMPYDCPCAERAKKKMPAGRRSPMDVCESIEQIGRGRRIPRPTNRRPETEATCATRPATTPGDVDETTPGTTTTGGEPTDDVGPT